MTALPRLGGSAQTHRLGRSGYVVPGNVVLGNVAQGSVMLGWVLSCHAELQILECE